MNWTWLGLAVLVLLAFSMVDGYRHGFVKEVVSALLVLISVALVWLINPYVNQFIRENTSVYEKIQTASGSFVYSLADGKETTDDRQSCQEIHGIRQRIICGFSGRWKRNHG